jgi:hypothetical protein
MRYALFFLLLAGCVSPEQRAERMLTRYGPACEKLGYEKDSDAYRDCLMRFEDQRIKRATNSAIQSK